jgi:hypothetical protein
MPTPQDRYYCHFCKGYHQNKSAIGLLHKRWIKEELKKKGKGRPSGAERRKHVAKMKRMLSGHSS